MSNNSQVEPKDSRDFDVPSGQSSRLESDDQLRPFILRDDFMV